MLFLVSFVKKKTVFIGGYTLDYIRAGCDFLESPKVTTRRRELQRVK